MDMYKVCVILADVYFSAPCLKRNFCQNCLSATISVLQYTWGGGEAGGKRRLVLDVSQ